jgi:hypothetical protein
MGLNDFSVKKPALSTSGPQDVHARFTGDKTGRRKGPSGLSTELFRLITTLTVLLK